MYNLETQSQIGEFFKIDSTPCFIVIRIDFFEKISVMEKFVINTCEYSFRSWQPILI